MIYDILEAKLAENGVAEPGVSLFRNAMPARCKEGVLIRGPIEGIEIDPFIEGWHKTEIQVIVRDTDPVRGMKLSSRVCKVLKTEAPEYYPASEERGPAHISLFYPKTLPIQYPRLEGNEFEFSQRFTAAFGFKPE